MWAESCRNVRCVQGTLSQLLPAKLQLGLLLLAAAASHAQAQTAGSAGTGARAPQGNAINGIQETPIYKVTPSETPSDSPSMAKNLAYIGAGFAALCSLLFVILITRLCTIHTLTRRTRRRSGKYHLASSDASSKDMSDPAVIEATITHINNTELFVPPPEPVTLVTTAPNGNMSSAAAVTVPNNRHAAEAERPKVIRIHSEFEELEANEETPPVPKKKAGASKLKVVKTKSKS